MKLKHCFYLVCVVLFSVSGISYALDYEPPAVLIEIYKATGGKISSSYEYIAQAEASQTVKITPEVSARITKLFFQEGALVKAGQTLFTLNSAQYQATVALRKAELSRADANLDYAKKYLSRLQAADRRSVPATDVDTANSQVKQAQAAVAEAKASLQLAQIDLNNTKITAPITGIIGKAGFTTGNYVAPGTILAQINQTDPIRVLFSMPDRDYIKNRNLDFKSELKLADESIYNQTGEIDFVNNEMNQDTGTISIWLKFSNPEGVLIPGELMRVLLTSPEQDAVFVPVSAVTSNNDGDFVYVIQNNKAHSRKVVLGPEKDKMYSILSGLNAGEIVASEGVQSLFDGSKVTIKQEN